MSSTEPASEEAKAQEMQQVIRTNHQVGLSLLHRMLERANNELARLAEDVVVQDLGDHFRLTVIAHSLNAGWCSLRLLESGYPRFSLGNARYLREGHIALTWAKAFPDQARALMEGRDAVGAPAEVWPTSGEMAKAVTTKLQADHAEDQNAANWVALMRALGETHNDAFSHAITKYAVGGIFFVEQGSFNPRVGPFYDEESTSEAIDHFVPLFLFVLQDATTLIQEIASESAAGSTTALLSEAESWWSDHPTPLTRPLGLPFPGFAESDEGRKRRGLDARSQGLDLQTTSE